jgi:Lrp/AsnC family transcriptional regulator for asnA, asnC and gidA
MKLDERDILLLDELQRDCKQSLKKLSRKVGMSITTAYDKIKKYEKEGIIRGCKALLAPEKIDNSCLVFMLVHLEPHTIAEKGLTYRDITKKISMIPNVLEAYAVSGEWDMLLKVRARDTHQLSNIVVDKLMKIEGIRRTHSIDVWETFKEKTEIPIRNKI